MQAADLMIDQIQEQTQEIVRTYTSALDQAGLTVAAIEQFESESATLTEEGWRLKQASHLGSLASPSSVIATYQK